MTAGCYRSRRNLPFFLLPVADNTEIFWEDTFDRLHSSFWNIEEGGGGWGNNELQYYTKNNITVSEGMLRIIARREDFAGYKYTSGRINTREKIFSTYGTVEARMKISATGNGLWPAFWLLGNSISTAGWPACGEIDIMEHINETGKVYGTIHYEKDNRHVYVSNYIEGIDIREWHTYRITWNSRSLSWFVDDTLFFEVSIDSSEFRAFHEPFFVIINLAVGGNWPGFTIDETKFPVILYVDYVRWKKP